MPRLLLVLILNLYLGTSLYASSGDMPLVISEIQKSVEKKYGVVFPEQNPMPRPPEEKAVRPSENKVVKTTTKTQIKKVPTVRTKKGLLDDGADQKVTPRPLVKKLVKPAKKTPGQLKMEKQLAKNRELLKKRREEYLAKRKGQKTTTSKKSSSGSKSSAFSGGDWMSQKKASVDSWGEQKLQETKKWQEDRLATIKRWQQARKKFKKILPALKKDLTDIPFGAASTGNISKSNTQTSRTSTVESSPIVNVAEASGSPLELSFIEEAFRIPIRQQGKRPTCAAFAAVRAVEILAKAMGKERDLSEQYFYYASKPDCQQSPCQRPGSWPRLAFVNSQRSSSYDIPLEKSCPYNDDKKAGNETQIPMKRSCQQGVAKISSFSLVKDRGEIHRRLKAGQPVIGGFRLSDDFFLNTGYVFKESGQKVGKREHAQGHAILLVGIMELPKALQRSQGRYCTLIANSWGEGWGRGGHACISDKWFDEYRYDMPFIALEKVAIR